MCCSPDTDKFRDRWFESDSSEKDDKLGNEILNSHEKLERERDEARREAEKWRDSFKGVRVSNKRRAQQLAAKVKPNDILVGHSDGCNLVDQALHELSSLHPSKVNCIYFNPALDRDTALAPIVNKCLVFHTVSDKVVWISKWLAFHPWGEMGMKGYKETKPCLHDSRYVNISYDAMGYSNLGHSGVFHSPLALQACFDIIQYEFMPIPRAIPIPEP